MSLKPSPKLDQRFLRTGAELGGLGSRTPGGRREAFHVGESLLEHFLGVLRVPCFSSSESGFPVLDVWGSASSTAVMKVSVSSTALSENHRDLAALSRRLGSGQRRLSSSQGRDPILEPRCRCRPPRPPGRPHHPRRTPPTGRMHRWRSPATSESFSVSFSRFPRTLRGARNYATTGFRDLRTRRAGYEADPMPDDLRPPHGSTPEIRPGDKPDELVLFEHGFVRLDECDGRRPLRRQLARVSFAVRKEEMDDRDEGLIKFLMRDRHGSPFRAQLVPLPHPVPSLRSPRMVQTSDRLFQRRIGSLSQDVGRFLCAVAECSPKPSRKAGRLLLRAHGRSTGDGNDRLPSSASTSSSTRST